MLNYEVLLFKAENAALLQVLQAHLTKLELEELNNTLYEFAEQCLANRANPALNQAVYLLKIDYGRMGS